MQASVLIREVMMGEGNGVASVIMLTFTKMPGPHADTLPLIPTPPLIMAVNIGEAVGCPLPS